MLYFIKPTDPHPISPAKAALLYLLCLIWLTTGLVGHDPWKPGEAYSFGLVYSMLKDGNWLVPTLAGEPYMDKPPLFYWSAALFAKLFHPLLTLHDGARLASGFYTALTLLFVGLSGRKLYGDNRGWAAVIILIGCLGFLVRAHQITTDLALLTGCAMMLYGFTQSIERPQHAGILIGTGTGIGFMAKGFIAPVFFVLTAAVLPLLYGNWRLRSYLNSMAIATLFALPWLTIWPLLLYLHSPQLFSDWLWTHNVGNWLDYVRYHFGRDAFYYMQNLPWLAWPAMPLAAWVVWKSRTHITQRDDLQLPLVNFTIMLVALSFSSTTNQASALPMLLPLTLLATVSLSMLKRGAANALDWFGIMTFALLAILMWWGWAGLLLENRKAWVPRQFRALQPDFAMEVHTSTFVIAIIATILWIIMIWRTGRSMRRATLNWASGVTLVWVLAMTLWLPWLDSGKSYRSMVNSLKKSLPQHYRCIGRENLSDDLRSMLHYLGDITTQTDSSERCDLRLIQRNKLSASPPPKNWEEIWSGSRKGTRNEQYYLYKQVTANNRTVGSQ